MANPFPALKKSFTTMPFDPARHHRRSIRLKGYDYSRAGAYFVTMCIYRRECLLGEVVNGEMVLNEYGRVVCEYWEWIPKQYPHVDLDEWTVMPNHMHGIIVMVDGNGRGGSRTAPTTKRKSLGRLVGAFKTVSTKCINQLRQIPDGPFWQRNYHEHIIRDERSLNNIRRYIRANPRMWINDVENPDRMYRVHPPIAFEEKKP